MKTFPLHPFLLPVFFVLHTHLQFAGLLRFNELVHAWLWASAGMIILYFLFAWWLKKKDKAGIAATITGLLFLYFGNIKQALTGIPIIGILSHYKFLLPLLALPGIFLLYRLKKIRPLPAFNLFLNFLLLAYVVLDGWNSLRGPGKEEDSLQLSGKFNLNSSPSRPGIYYIVLDCYPSSAYQREVLGVEENMLDSFLTAKGFFVNRNSKSNYHNTAFSMASVFRMQYPRWLREVEALEPYHYNKAVRSVTTAPLFSYMHQNGYSLRNLSIFDLPGHPSLRKERFLSTTGSELIFYHTLWKCLRRDVFPHFFPASRDKLRKEQRENNLQLLGKIRPYNQLVLDSLVQSASPVSSATPMFTYAHLGMPHFPYFFDSAGRPYPDELVYGENMIRDRERFRQYIGYTNRQAARMLDSLFKGNKGADIIILQSDHGLNDIPGSRKEDAFRNYSAFYFPDRDYRSLYHGMSNVNSFRIILNKYFGQQLPLLNDSTIYLK